MVPSVSPIAAATVLLLREAPAGGLETLLLRRHGKSSFMSDNFVFPGGKLDGADAALAFGDVGTALRAANAALVAEIGEATRAAAFYVAAARELFEEAGVLLARHRDGSPLGATPKERSRRVELRRRLRAGEIDFAALLATDDLILSPEALHYFARWITPSIQRKRFDARFFLAACPAGEEPSADLEEMVEQRWLSPRAALEAYRARALRLPPPTLHSLTELAGVPDFAAARELAHRRQAAPIPPIMPKGTLLDERLLALLLPWDPLYEMTPGEGEPVRPPHPFAVGASRFLLEEDLWTGRAAT